MDDVSTLHERIRQILERWDESENRNLEVVINEAINNVLLHGSGDGYLRLRMFKGRRIVIRVKDCKLGSDAGDVLQQYQAKSAEDLLQLVTEEGGRGILLMKLFTDRIFYSQDGSEVLLVYKKKH
jgi:anti-sigma regulatory factor (Ser/Thr protein kinase)